MDIITAPFRRALLEVIPCAVFMIDADWRVIFWNRAAEQLTGYAAAEVLGADGALLEIATCRGADGKPAESLCPFEAGVEELHFECEIARKDGAVVPVVRRIRAVLDDAGNRVGAIQALVDVSLIRGARTQIRELRQEIARAGRFGGMIGSSPAMRKLYEAISLIAPTDASVVVEGPTGTGKELVARTIHAESGRSERLFLPVNCGALPEAMLEAELFGHTKGAFTGATADRVGRFEDAGGGTLFLDEIAEMPLSSQVKLLRVLQEREVVRLGENRPRPIDVRVIAAANVELAQRVADGRFREDLFYRLRVVGLKVPPLRDRREDIPELVGHFIERFNARYNRQIRACSPAALAALTACDFPGNVRQLEHALEHAFVVTGDDKRELSVDALPPEIAAPAITPPAATTTPASRSKRLTPTEQAAQIRDALAAADGNKAQAARDLGITRDGLYKKMRRLGIA